MNTGKETTTDKEIITGKVIIADASELVNAVDELMQAKTTQKVVEVARKVKCGGAINAAVDLVGTPLAQIKALLIHLRDLAAQLTGISGLLGLMEPLLAGSNRLVQTSADQLRAVGLSGPVMDGVKGAVGIVADKGGNILKGGQAVIDNYPDKADVERLITEFNELGQTITNFKQDVGGQSVTNVKQDAGNG